ncbi:MAG TPA: metal-dependent hydrolase [Spongiibacteraceae bacterium]|nr:metal-dependent hydrolase [Spongiibacteraceae bacterium]MBN51770.1 metal-dependent hydrolase [Spongiibacteraceae bacterium]HCS28111.1 metal-dependent hydrolase [Spongiibacteraceae bacterium]|tara:strand:- start:298 stop:1143 length:846 start_codon:yes stop_codon:yes gene_type:complete
MTEPSKMATENTITVRRMNFEINADMDKYWFNGNPLISAFFYALSATFPDGERFFIDTVRYYQKDVEDPVLKQQIRAFIGQEAHHGKAHEDFNEALEAKGFPMAVIAAKAKGLLDLAKERLSPQRQLAITVALEHVTATLAEHALRHPDLLEQMDPTFRDMIVWHAVEEIEHKSVAFDVFRERVGNEYLRRRVMFMTLIMFFGRVMYFQKLILRADNRKATWREWWQAMKFFWGKDGLVRESLIHFAKAFKKGFHPSDIDQQPLVNDWQQRYPEIAALQTN